MLLGRRLGGVGRLTPQHGDLGARLGVGAVDRRERQDGPLVGAVAGERGPAESKKRLVERLFDVIYGTGDNLHIIDEVVAADYVQHNPLAGQGREDLRQFFEQLVPLPDWLDSRGTVAVNLIAEGEFVVRQEIRTHGLLIDVFRVRDGLL
jgi:predicted SnoaL-like aldol condensation-catalyzing enzyme